MSFSMVWMQALLLALHKNKLTDEQRKYGIDRVESKVNFALSCGARSSPMVIDTSLL
jgi:hypothetical protein